jgi:hypothetical protein
MEFDFRRSIVTEDGDYDEEALDEYEQDIMELFADSPEAAAIEDEVDVGWSGMIVHYAAAYEGVSLPDMTPHVFERVLFNVVPRKVSCEPQDAEEIVLELRAFFQFLKRQFGAPHAAACAARLDEKAAVKLRNELADPSNWGMAKSFFMHGQAAGFDMRTEEGAASFSAAYNASLAGRLAPEDIARPSLAGGPAPEHVARPPLAGPLARQRRKAQEARRRKRKMEKASRKRKRR